uniref:Uncharacterized protein n=1 Tax=Acrobeloides nanus TaxID=290746 RepID=A0A914D7B1_9BILA
MHRHDHNYIYTEITKLNDQLFSIKRDDKSFTSSLVILLKDTLYKLQAKREEAENLKRSYENAIESYHLLMDRYMKTLTECKNHKEESRRNLTEKSFIIETLSIENTEVIKNVTDQEKYIEKLENLKKQHEEELKSLQETIEELIPESVDHEDSLESMEIKEETTEPRENSSVEDAPKIGRKGKTRKKSGKIKQEVDESTEISLKSYKKNLTSIRDYVETVKTMGQKLDKCGETKKDLDDCQEKITKVYQIYTTDDLESAIVKTSITGDMKSDLLEWLTNLLNKYTNLDESTRDYNSICSEISEKLGYKYFHTAYWNCFLTNMGYYIYYDDYYAVFDFENNEDLIIFNVPKQTNCSAGFIPTTTKHPVLDGGSIYE